MYIQFGIPNSS